MQGFLRNNCRQILIEGEGPVELIEALAAYSPPPALPEVIKSESAANQS